MMSARSPCNAFAGDAQGGVEVLVLIQGMTWGRCFHYHQVQVAYRKVRDSAQSFMVTQYGVAIFTWDAAASKYGYLCCRAKVGALLSLLIPHTHIFTLCRYIVRPYNFNVFPSTASSAVDKSFTAQVPLHNNTANSSSRLWLCNADPPPPLSPTRLPHCSSCRRTSLTLTSGCAKAFPFCHLTRKPRIELHGEQHTRPRTHTHRARIGMEVHVHCRRCTTA